MNMKRKWFMGGLAILLVGIGLSLGASNAAAQSRRHSRGESEDLTKVRRYLGKAEESIDDGLYAEAQRLLHKAVRLLMPMEETPEKLRYLWRAYGMNGDVDPALDLYETATDELRQEWETGYENLCRSYGALRVVLSPAASNDEHLVVDFVALHPSRNVSCSQPPQLFVKEAFENQLLAELRSQRRQVLPASLPRGNYALVVGLAADGSGLDYKSPVISVEVDVQGGVVSEIEIPFEHRPSLPTGKLLAVLAILISPFVL